MRLPLTILILAATLGIASAPALAATKKHRKPSKKHGLTAQQIRAAVRKAESSPNLWATVNCCGACPPTSGSDTVGIRGEMPSLGFSATLVMNVSVFYWNYPNGPFLPALATQVVSLGKGTHGLHQGGVDFPFNPPAMGSQFLVRGTITFEWMLGSKVIGKVTRNTGHGYANVGYENPPGYNSGTCILM